MKIRQAKKIVKNCVKYSTGYAWCFSGHMNEVNKTRFERQCIKYFLKNDALNKMHYYRAGCSTIRKALTICHKWERNK